MTQNQNLFFQKFGITPNDLQRYLGEALSAGGDYADLYFEYLTSTSISVDESIVKSASQGISAGCGVRVLAGDRTGYAYTDDLAPEKILRAARTAALIARGPAKNPVEGFKENAAHQLYPVASVSAEADIATKLDLVMRADRAARAYDPRIVQVRGGYFDETRQILVIGSDGTFAS
ncbi:MAG TPA: DNA gyrase modulator, partial [Candidatus Angelobacter sp.]|nr:DNA gyrase modulator [Candidatus Angelobacter sp.]